MADMRRYSSGDKPQFKADTVNAWTEAAEAHRSGQNQNHNTKTITNTDSNRQSVKNGSGVSLPPYSVLEFDNPIILPSTNENAYKAKIGFVGEESTTDNVDKIAITQQYLSDGAIDPGAILAGVTFVRLTGVEGKTKAGSKASQATMETSDDGNCVILYDPGEPDGDEEGERIAIIRIDGGGSGESCTCDEVHEFYTNQNTTSGTFTANYDINGIAENITWDWDATNAEVETEFEGHSEISASEVEVTGGPWPDVALYVKFSITGLTNVNFPTVDNASLTGNGAMRRFSKGT